MGRMARHRSFDVSIDALAHCVALDSVCDRPTTGSWTTGSENFTLLSPDQSMLGSPLLQALVDGGLQLGSLQGMREVEGPPEEDGDGDDDAEGGGGEEET